MSTLTKKQIQERTKIPPSTLNWLLHRLNIEPAKTTKTVFGRPIFHYDEGVIGTINEWLNKSITKRQATKEGKIRCLGGCNNYYHKDEMISVYCKRCYVEKALRNLFTHNKPWEDDFDYELIGFANDYITYLGRSSDLPTQE